MKRRVPAWSALCCALTLLALACTSAGPLIRPSSSGLGCSGATDCASCLQASSELCIWCAGSGTCQDYAAACPSVSGNHGYFVGGPLYPSATAAQAQAACALPCADNHELRSDTAGRILNPEPCCSSSAPSSGTNGSSCVESNAGEPCAIDEDCVYPEKCTGGVCTGKPATPQVTCTDSSGGSCSCQLELGVDAGATPSCGASTVTNGACCATDGWPSPGTGASCSCWSVQCIYTSGPLGGPGNCGCASSYAGTPHVMSSCSGALCCSDPASGSCLCYESAANVDCGMFGPASVKVPSCTTSTVGCPPRSHAVLECYSAPIGDAGTGD